MKSNNRKLTTGGKEGKDAQTCFAYKTSATQVLFLQHVIDSLKPGGRCGIVMDELEHFDEFFKLFNPSTLKLSESKRSWSVPLEEIEIKNYDLKAVNPNRKNRGDTRTPEELIAIIKSHKAIISQSINELNKKLND